MAILLRKTDRVKVKIDELELEMAPLSFAAKMEINEVLIGAGENDLNASMNASRIAMKHSIKSIKGIECLDGSKYVLEFEGDLVSDECIDDLLNLEHCPKLMIASTAFLKDIPSEILDPSTGKKLEGVEIKMPGKKKVKK